MSDQYSYQFASRICQNGAFQGMSQVFLENQTQTRDMINTYNFDHLKARLRMKGLSPKANLLLSSQGFRMGLDDCFRDNQLAKTVLVAYVYAADVGGDLTGISQGALTQIGIGKIFSKLVKIWKGFVLLAAAPVGFIAKDYWDRSQARELEKAHSAQEAAEIRWDYTAIISELNNPNSTVDRDELESLKQTLEAQATERQIDLNRN